MGIGFQCERGATERRRAERSRQEAVGTIRERARSACTATFEGISNYGCHIQSHSLLLQGNTIWVKLPGLDSIVGHIVWTENSSAGVVFETPLHPAVAKRFLFDNHLEAQGIPAGAVAMDNAADPLLPRREQIMRGMGDSGLFPFKTRKQPKADGLRGLISRQTPRRADHRCEERFENATAITSTTLKLRSREAAIENVSASGLQISIELTAAIGEEIPVEFDGFEPISGKVIWMGQGKMGLSLPPDSIELSDG